MSDDDEVVNLVEGDAAAAATDGDTASSYSTPERLAFSRSAVSIHGCGLAGLRVDKEELRRRVVLPGRLVTAIAKAIRSRDLGAAEEALEAGWGEEDAPDSPLVVFVNSRSGGRHGPVLKGRLQNLMGKGQVELMGGDLTVTSQENCGSTFTFALPFKVPLKLNSRDAYEMGVYDDESLSHSNTDGIVGSFLFKPRRSGESVVNKTNLLGVCNYGALDTSVLLSEETMLFSGDDKARKSTFTPHASPNSDVISSLAKAEGPAYQKYDCKVNYLISANSREKKRTYLKQDLSVNKFDNIYISPCGQKIANSENGSMMSFGGANLEQGNTSTLWVSKNMSSSRILLVEDNMINVIVAQKMMKQLGYTIEVVNNGLEAIHALQRFDYDLIFMDICMPVMDGLQATRLIRSFEALGVWDASVAMGTQHSTPSPNLLPHPSAAERRRVPIIAMTANAMAESAGDCLASGMDSFVSKPVTFQSLKQCLQQYLLSC